MPRAWSTYQHAIFNFVESGQGNAIVGAVAGSGKSTTIVESLNHTPTGSSSILLAFNKAIADDLKTRGVNARTFHSLTYSPVTRFKNARTIDGDKLAKLVKANLSGDEAYIYGSFITKLVGLARQTGIGCLVADTEAEWMAIIQYHDLELDHDDASFGRAIDLARNLLTWSNASPMVDFDDLLYCAVKDGLSLPKFDFVFIDEAQDTNAIQRAIIRKLLKPTSRVIAVGDPAQAIYGFRGADSNSLDLIAEEFSCKRLPLTVSYRCATAIVDYAHTWVSHIESAPGAPVGSVEWVQGTDWALTGFASDDLVVCRTTKPLIQLGYRFLKAGIPARIMGREIGQGLKSLIAKLNAKGIDQLQVKLDAWTTREIEKAIVKQQEAKSAAIQDKADAIACLIDALPETNRTIPALLAVIDQLFADGVQAVTLATIHKAKGLEAPRVYWLNSSQCPSKWAKQPWQQQQEANLCYVAVTRARTSLVLIEDGGK